MEPRRIGELELSLVGIGCNNFGRRIDEAASRSVVDAALAEGVTFFDTADIYGDGLSERYLGQALAGRRQRAVVATKFGLGDEPVAGASAKTVRRAVDASLRRLGLDHIDLYQLHEPDDATPIVETLGALNEAIEVGKVREIGCSNVSAAQLDEAAEAASAEGLQPFRSVQNHYNLLDAAEQADVLEACRRHGIAFLPYYPLARGLLTGKYRRGQPPPEDSRLAGADAQLRASELSGSRLATVERVREYAEDNGHTLLELAFSWLASQDVVACVMAGATRPEQVRANVAAASAWPMDENDIREARERAAG